MGACYTAQLHIGFENKADKKMALKKLQEFVHSERANFQLDSWAKDGAGTDSLEDIFKILLASQQGYFTADYDGQWSDFENDFDASYGWEGVLIDMFELITPYLKNGSKFYLDCDNDYDEFIVDNGECVQLH